MSRHNLKFNIFGGRIGHLSMSRQNLKFKIYSGRVGHLCMSRLNPKFKIFSEGGRSVIFPYLGKIWNLKVSLRVEGWGIFPCPGQIYILKLSVRIGRSVIFSCPGQIWSLKMFRKGWGSRSNLKFKNFIEGWGGWPSYHVQAKSGIYIVRWGRGSVIFPCPGKIWGLKMFRESWASRQNLKFITFGEGEGLVISPYSGQIWNLRITVRVGGPGQIWYLKCLVR